MACLAPETKMKNNKLQEVYNALQAHVNYSSVTFLNLLLLPPYAILSNDSFCERTWNTYFILYILLDSTIIGRVTANYCGPVTVPTPLRDRTPL